MKQITLLFLILLASTALSASLAACASAPPPATVPHETLDTATAAPHPTEAPTATATATLTPEITVTEGSEWAKRNVPIGLEITVEGNVTYAINKLGEKIEIARDGKTAEWLQTPMAATQKDTIDNPEPYKVPYDPKITKMMGRLNAQPFPEGTVPGEVGDVTLEKVFTYQQLGWSSAKDIPAKIVGYFTTEYEGKILYVKIVEWLTKDEGIVYLSYINSRGDIDHGYGSQGTIFPVGFLTRSPSSDEVQPKSTIGRNNDINNQLQIWVDTGSPTAALEDFFLVGGEK